MGPTSSGALTGFRILEIGGLVAGPFAARLLADHGADVIKIEAPGKPDPLRTWGQYHRDGRGFFWSIHARNKRCITLDLRHPDGQELFLRLVEKCDAVIENFRPGTLERWDLGFERLQWANPRVVLARVSGFGQTGPSAPLPGYASVAEARAGFRYVTGYPGAPPVRTALSIGDSLGGLFAAQGVLAALLARERLGVGQVIDTALTDACLALTESLVPDFDQGGVVRQPGGTRLDGVAPSNIYLTADDEWLLIAANQDSLFLRLCDAMGMPDLTGDERFRSHTARGANQDSLDALIGGWARQRHTEEIECALRAVGVVCGRIATAADIVVDKQFRARDMLVKHHDPGFDVDVLGPGVVPKLSGTPGAVRWAGPSTPGSHNREVFGELLGLTGAQLDAYVQAGVL